MPANLSKKSVVKHRTNKAFHPGPRKSGGGSGQAGTGANSTGLGERGAAQKGKGRSGFQVGPKHAPDGAYLGRAKKIKADLIEKAKVKKRFFKSIRQAEGDDGDASTTDIRDEGKFAPEGRNEEPEGTDILYQMRNRTAPPPSSVVDKKETGRERKKGQAKGRIAQADNTTTKGESASVAALQPSLTKEERQKRREKRQDSWNAQSGSQRGRERGQPNLGARMDLLLEKIKQG